MRPVGPGRVGKGRIGDDVVVGAELFAVQELGFHERALTAGLDACRWEVVQDHVHAG